MIGTGNYAEKGPAMIGTRAITPRKAQWLAVRWALGTADSNGYAGFDQVAKGLWRFLEVFEGLWSVEQF